MPMRIHEFARAMAHSAQQNIDVAVILDLVIAVGLVSHLVFDGVEFVTAFNACSHLFFSISSFQRSRVSIDFVTDFAHALGLQGIYK